MTKSNSERQAEYKAKIKASKKQLNCFISNEAFDNLNRKAKQTGKNKLDFLESLLLGNNADSEKIAVLEEKIISLKNESAASENRFRVEKIRERDNLAEAFKREKAQLISNKEKEIKKYQDEIAKLNKEIIQLKNQLIDFEIKSGSGRFSDIDIPLLKKIRQLCHPDKHGNSELSHIVTTKLNNILR